MVFVAGALLRVTNLGAGVVTFAGGSGVTVTNTAASLSQFQTATLVRTGSDAWTVIRQGADAPGMDLITPTSVAGSGVTVSGGKVSFTGATEVSVNGCFTSAYDNYMLMCDLTAASASNSDITARLRLSGTNATTNYAGVRTYSNGGAVNTLTTGTYNAFFMTSADTSIPTIPSFSAKLFRPAIAVATTSLVEALQSSSGSAVFQNLMSMYHSTATAYDGISIISGSGNIAGTLRIYGLRNS